jgi:uncharacterized protein YjdB
MRVSIKNEIFMLLEHRQGGDLCMKKKHYLLVGLFALVAIAWFLVRQGDTLSADDAVYKIKISEQEQGDTYTMTRKSVVATLTDANSQITSGSSISWSENSSGKVVKLTNTSNAAVTIEAVGAGTTTLTATITSKTDNKSTIKTLNIIVGYVLDEDPQNGFTLIKGLSDSAIMALNINDTGTLDFIFKPSASNNVSWESADTNVVSMDKTSTTQTSNNSGDFQATGVGKTTITATYKSDDGRVGQVSVDVYVGPTITVGNASTSTVSSGTAINVNKGDLIYVGAILQGTSKVLTDRIEWVVKSSTGAAISDSTTGTAQYFIAESSYNPYLTVDATAGTYMLDVYTVGVHSANVEDDNKLKKTVKLQVLAECKDYVDTDAIFLQVGDTYDIADVFNLTPEQFSSLFDVKSANGATGSAVSLEYITQDGKGLITAIKEGKQNLEIKLKSGQEKTLQELMGDTNQTINANTTYKLEVNIYQSFSLDRSRVDLAIGGSLQLEPLYNKNLGVITWTSSDTSKVTVDENGIIKGVKVTTSDVTITASMKIAGRTLKATCKVTVHNTATKIILTPNEIDLRLGQSETIKVTFNPSDITAIEGLQWLVTEEGIVDLTVNSSTSLTVTAAKAGSTILTAVNSDNFISAYCKITVSTPINQISLTEGDALEVKLSQEAVKFHAKYNEDATNTTLSWSSSNTSVATIDEYGFATLKGAGTTIITVIPVWNPNNVMAQCRLTVLQSATGFALNASEITVEVGEKATLTPALTPTSATATITWRTMNSKIATVSNGVVTGVAPGQTYIVANTENGYVANCLVTVTQKATGISLTTYNITVNVGESYTVTATPNPTTSTETTFTWTSKDPSIATVKDGVVTGVSAGSTVVLVKTKTGDVTYLYVTVKDKATALDLNYTTKTIAKGASFTLKPIFTPSNTTNKNVTWSSSNKGVATVSDAGKVTGVKTGNTIITCVSEDGGFIATCLVTVVQQVTTVKLNPTSYKLGVGKTVTIKATVKSNSSSNTKVKWTSSNTKVATVNSSGKVTGKKIGTATITATATDGSKKKATCKIKVIRQATSVKLNKSYLTLIVGRNSTLKATVKPSNAAYKTVNWSSSNTSVALVDDSGLVRGLSVGTTTITATAKDNSKKSDTCFVEVIDPIPATSILLADKNMVMIRGESQSIGYTIVPSNSTDKVTISSSNKNIATVSSTGKITARRAGSTTITITTSSGKQAEIQLQVIGLNKTSLTLEQYDYETLTVEGVTSGITWYSANPSIATVSGGKVVGRKVGSTTIYAKFSGITLGCKVKVKKIS